MSNLSEKDIVQIIIETAQGPVRTLRKGMLKASAIPAHEAYGTVIQHACFMILIQMGYSTQEIINMFEIKEID